MKELVLKECKKCHALVKVLKDCDCEDCKITCCKDPMVVVIPNSTDASVEKHTPTYTIEGNEIKIKIPHVMDEEHYMEWILVKTKNQNIEKLLKPGEEATMVAPYEKGSIIYTYCNKHGLWKKEVE